MPANATIERVGRTDFLATLAPGFLLLAAGIFAAAAINKAFTLTTSAGATEAAHDLGNTESMDGCLQFLQILADNWSLSLVAIVFAAYVVGSIPRAMAVNTADRICAVCFAWVPRRRWDQLLHKSDFPYQMGLEWTLADMKANGRCLDVTYPSKGTSHTMFNYWKANLCQESSATFAYTQSLEARTRLFAGMFWAGAAGVFISTSVYITFLVLFLFGGDWWLAFLVLVVVGIVMVGLTVKYSARRQWPETSAPTTVDQTNGAPKNPAQTTSLATLERLVHPRRFKVWLGLSTGTLGICAIWLVANIPNPWLQWNTVILAISLALAISYGMQLRRVRGQEADLVFLAYLAMQDARAAMPITDLIGLTSRVREALRSAGIETAFQLANLTEKRLSGIPGIGPKSIKSIKHCLKSYGSRLRR